MKNKLKTILFILIGSFCSINTAFSEPNMVDVGRPEHLEATAVPVYYELPVQSFEEALIQEVDCTDAYSYFTVGVGPVVFIPNVGIGYRERYSQYGWDAGVSFSTLGYIHQLTAHAVGHYYLNPAKQNSAYLGFGLMGSGVFANHKSSFGTLSTDFVFGKEFKRIDDSRHFLEMHVSIPTLAMNSKHQKGMYLPLMYIKYGISF